jgi:predicted esterase
MFRQLCLVLSVLMLANPPTRAVETFDVDGSKAVIHPAADPAKDKPWLWYAPALKGGVSIVQHKLYAEACQRAGIAIAGCDLGEVRGAPGSTAKFTQFYDEMIKRGYSPKPILLGQSRGGMMTLAWAFRNPDKVRAWIGIYPVCNLTSWPLKNSKRETLADFALTEDELTSRLKEFNPPDNLAGLVAAKVPLFSVHGDNDSVVPHIENTLLLKERYESLGGSFTVKIVPGEGHKVGPSFFECQELADFLINVAK